jgi:hypothetical protein
MATCNGTVASGCNIYRNHSFSPFNAVKHNARASYQRDLRLIEVTVGRRLIRNLTMPDVQNWYNHWREPEIAGGRERIDRAHNGVCMLCVWNMDARAGGATDAYELGATLEEVQGALTHSKSTTTPQYLRRGGTRNIEQVAKARAKRRADGGENG